MMDTKLRHVESERRLIAKLLTEEDEEEEVVVQWRSRSAQTDNEEDHMAKHKDSRLMTVTFSVIVISILAMICFSIWLSVQVGLRNKRLPAAGGEVI